MLDEKYFECPPCSVLFNQCVSWPRSEGGKKISSESYKILSPIWMHLHSMVSIRGIRDIITHNNVSLDTDNIQLPSHAPNPSCV